MDHDIDGHGTHCAGTIFGRDVDGRRIGIATGVQKALIGKVLGKGGGSTDQLVEAINWARDNGADIISMSLGLDFVGYQKELMKERVPSEVATSMALAGYRANVQTFDRLSKLYVESDAIRSVVLVAAAGNESSAGHVGRVSCHRRTACGGRGFRLCCCNRASARRYPSAIPDRLILE